MNEALFEIELTTPPVEYPVTLSEVKTWIKENYGTDALEDGLISSLIASATEMLERYSGLSFITRTVTAHFETFEHKLELPYGPVSSLTSITRTYNGEDTVLASSDYSEEGGNFKKITFNNYFSTSGQFDYGLKIVYDCGYGEAADVPEAIKTAIKSQVTDMYFHRGDDMLSAVGVQAKMIIRPLSRNL